MAAKSNDYQKTWRMSMTASRARGRMGEMDIAAYNARRNDDGGFSKNRLAADRLHDDLQLQRDLKEVWE